MLCVIRFPCNKKSRRQKQQQRLPDLTTQAGSPVHHVDPFEVDESFADLQAEQDQSDVCQFALVLCQVVPQLRKHQARQEIT